MATPCEQANNIENINKVLVRMEEATLEDRRERRESEKQMMELLQKVADQSARINHLEQQGEHRAHESEILFERMREAELTLASNSPAFRQQTRDKLNEMEDRIGVLLKRMDKVCRIIGFMSHKYMVAVYACFIVFVLAGTLTDFLCHFDTITKIFKFIMGAK